MRERWFGLGGLLVLALALAACGGGGGGGSSGSGASGSGGGDKPVAGGTFTVAMAQDAITFDPLRLSDVYSRMVLTQVADPLFDVDKDGKVAGRLVESAENPEPNVHVWK